MGEHNNSGVAHTDAYVLPRSVSTNHPDGGAPLTRDLLDRAYVRVDEAPQQAVVVRLATCHGDQPIEHEWNFAQFKDRIGAGWDTDVGRLTAENERLRATLVEAREMLGELRQRIAEVPVAIEVTLSGLGLIVGRGEAHNHSLRAPDSA